MAREVNPISVRLNPNRSSDPSRSSDYYHGKLVYQDVNLRDYFGSIRPPTRKTFGFRLGRCIIHHFTKRTFIHLSLPRRPRRLKRRGKSRPGKGRWWAFGKVRSIGPDDGTEEERNEVRGRRRGAGKTVKSIRLDDRTGEERNEVRIWPRKKQRYGYHDRSPSRQKNLSKWVSGWMAYKHPMSGKYAAKKRQYVNDIAFSIEDDTYVSGKTKFFKFLFPKKFRSDGPTSKRLLQTIPAVRPSFNYSVMQYFFHMKNQIHFDPIDVVVPNNLVAPGVAEPGGADEQGGSLDKRIRSRIGFFVESLTAKTEQGEFLAEAKKRFTHLIRQANDSRFARTTKTCWSISLFPFFGATFFFPRDNLGVSNNKIDDAPPLREQLLGKFRRKLRNLLGKEKVIKLMEKLIDLGGIGELIKGIGMIDAIILRNRSGRIPYGYNYYLNEVQKMRSLLSDGTNTNTSIGSVKIESVYQSASPIAQDISFQPRNGTGSFRSIFGQIVRDITFVMPKRVKGIRICRSGRSKGAEIARTECREYGKTSCNVSHHKIDHASAKVSTRYGISGVKVWISYSNERKGRAISETYKIS
uniref:Ribosomal protein S3 n=2 Tax=Cycas TaxID=3395 RepID=A0A8F4MIK7_CYCRE|nr:ribosomal protein S3 [Cycas taitungensis]QXE43879.1 ribosomal protein S3 [Cycas revoluta]BAF98418.1 ribosomal protein S3 [Cycas taitungensis]